MTDIKHLQNVLLGIVKDIDEFCTENGIVYYLIAGSALGAVRHNGFIPWDDDLDIAMDSDNYIKFLRIAKEKLDHSKYYIQEGYKDWSMPYSKIILLGTMYKESNFNSMSHAPSGIFIDIFPLENAPKNIYARLWQFFCAKLVLANCLNKNGYKTRSLVKKIWLFISQILDATILKNFFIKQVEKYRGKDTLFLGSFSGNLRFHNIFFKRSDFGKPIKVPFEDSLLPIPHEYDAVLRQQYGNYMVLPPEEKRVSPHIQEIDFGCY